MHHSLTSQCDGVGWQTTRERVADNTGERSVAALDDACDGEIRPALEAMGPAVEGLLVGEQFGDVLHVVEVGVDLLPDEVPQAEHFLADAAPLHLDHVVVDAAFAEDFAGERVQDGQEVREEGVVVVVGGQLRLQLGVGHVAGGSEVTQRDGLLLVFEVFPVELEEVQQDFAVCVLPGFVELLVVGCEHDEETVGADASAVVLLPASEGEVVLEGEEYAVHGGVLCEPAPHEFGGGGDFLCVVVGDADVDVDDCSPCGVFEVEAVGEVGVGVGDGVGLAFGHAVADGGVDGQPDQGLLAPLEVGGAGDDPAHGVDVDGDVGEVVVDGLPRAAGELADHDVDVGGGEGEADGVGAVEDGVDAGVHAADEVADAFEGRDLALVDLVALVAEFVHQVHQLVVDDAAHHPLLELLPRLLPRTPLALLVPPATTTGELQVAPLLLASRLLAGLLAVADLLVAAVAFEGGAGEFLGGELVGGFVGVLETADVGEFVVFGVQGVVEERVVCLCLVFVAVGLAGLVRLEILCGFDLFEAGHGGDIHSRHLPFCIVFILLDYILLYVSINHNYLLCIVLIVMLLLILFVLPLPFLLLGVVHQIQYPFGHLQIHLLLVGPHALHKLAPLLQISLLYIFQRYAQTLYKLFGCVSVVHELSELLDAGQSVLGGEVVAQDGFLEFAADPLAQRVETAAVEPQQILFRPLLAQRSSLGGRYLAGSYSARLPDTSDSHSSRDYGVVASQSRQSRGSGVRARRRAGRAGTGWGRGRGRRREEGRCRREWAAAGQFLRKASMNSELSMAVAERSCCRGSPRNLLYKLKTGSNSEQESPGGRSRPAPRDAPVLVKGVPIQQLRARGEGDGFGLGGRRGREGGGPGEAGREEGVGEGVEVRGVGGGGVELVVEAVVVEGHQTAAAVANK